VGPGAVVIGGGVVVGPVMGDVEVGGELDVGGELVGALPLPIAVVIGPFST
jgi:hypothetical protein